MRINDTGTRDGDVKTGDWVTIVHNTTGIPRKAVGQFVQITRSEPGKLYFHFGGSTWYMVPSDVMVGPAYD